MMTMHLYKRYVSLYTGYALMTFALCATIPPSFVNGIPNDVSSMSSIQSVNGNSLSSSPKQPSVLAGIIVTPKLQTNATSERASFPFDTTVMPQSASMNMSKALQSLKDTATATSDTEIKIKSANPTLLNLNIVNSVNENTSVLLNADTNDTEYPINTSFIYEDFNSSMIYDDYNSSMIYDDFNTSLIDDTVNSSLIDNAQMIKQMLSTDTNDIKPQIAVNVPGVIKTQPGLVSTSTLGRMVDMQLGVNKAQTSKLSWNNSGLLPANDFADVNMPGIKAVSIDPDSMGSSEASLPKALSIRSTDGINITDTMASADNNRNTNVSVQQMSPLSTTADNIFGETAVKPPGLEDEITSQHLGNDEDGDVNGWQKQNKSTRVNKHLRMFKPLSANNSIIRKADKVIDNMYKNTKNWLTFINVNITSPDNMAGEMQPLDSLINRMLNKISVKVFSEK